MIHEQLDELTGRLASSAAWPGMRSGRRPRPWCWLTCLWRSGCSISTIRIPIQLSDDEYTRAHAAARTAG